MKEAFGIIPVILEKEGVTVELYDSLTIGESRRLQRLLINSGFKPTEEGKPDYAMAGVFLDLQDVSFECLFKSAYKTETKEVITINDLKEFLANLSIAEGQKLLKVIDQITSQSSLNDDAKKN